jgi:hypothetical protein
MKWELSFQTAETTTPPLFGMSVEELRNIYKACRINTTSVSERFAPTRVSLAADTAARVRHLLESHPDIARFTAFFTRRRIPERAILVANETLGSTANLAPLELQRYRDAHYGLVVEMLWMWLLDDTLDASPELSACCGELIDRVAALIEHQNDGGTPVVPERPAHPVLLDVCKGIEALLDEYHSQVSVRPTGALFCQSMRAYLNGYRNTHGHFSDWNQYLLHRTYNGGLWSTQLHTAVFHTDSAATEFHCKHRELLERFSVIGGLANDLFGLEQDRLEGVATGTDVLKRCYDLCDDVQAARKLIEIHNDTVDELWGAFHNATDASEQLLLFAALRTAWAARILHQEVNMIYPGALLRSSLPPAPHATRRHIETIDPPSQ